MKGFPATHIIYFEEINSSAKVTRKLIDHYPSIITARKALDMIYKENRLKGAYLEGLEVRIKVKNMVVKRWVIASMEKGKQLNLGRVN